MSLLGKFRKLILLSRVRSFWTVLLAHRVAAGVEHVVVLNLLSEVLTVVDIGANRGQFALAARHVFPPAKIFSFEPLPGAAAKFRAVFAKDDNVSLIESAVGPVTGRASIHLSARDDSSSLLPIAAAQENLFPGTREVGVTNVPVARLSHHLLVDDIVAPALLKLDVQGFELQVLLGSEDAIRHFEWMYVECSFVELYEGQAFADEVIAWLRDRNFALIGVYHMAYDATGAAVQADFLFRRIGGGHS